jgi:hypothetical protein
MFKQTKKYRIEFIEGEEYCRINGDLADNSYYQKFGVSNYNDTQIYFGENFIIPDDGVLYIKDTLYKAAKEYFKGSLTNNTIYSCGRALNGSVKQDEYCISKGAFKEFFSYTIKNIKELSDHINWQELYNIDKSLSDYYDRKYKTNHNQ